MTLDQLLGRTIECGCGQSHVVYSRHVGLARGAVADTGALMAAAGVSDDVLLVGDPDTLAAAGAQTRASLEGAGARVRVFALPSDPVARPELVAAIRQARGDAAGYVAVGAGTVNDLVKAAAFADDRPYGVVGTALSMNGYTSSIVALLEGGVKRTRTARPPLAVVLDLDICAAAPRAMTLAGLGDMLSKPFSEADWRLATALDGGYYCDRPGALLSDAFDRMLRDADGIGRSDPDALESLAESVLLSGISMAMAGGSSPASGGEHLVSHYWDMMRYAVDEHPFALHGTQVGVACVMIESLHHRVLAALPGLEIDTDRLVAAWPPTERACAAAIRGRHRALPSDVVDSIVEQALPKWRPPDEYRARLARIESLAPRLHAHLEGALLPPGAVANALLASGGRPVPSRSIRR